MRRRVAVKAVFFDIGNVLLRSDPAEVRRSILAVMNKEPDAVVRMIASGPIADAVERGRMTPRELYRLFRERLGFKGGFKAFRLLWCGRCAPDRGAQSLLENVAKRCPVYLLSNTNRLHYESIRRKFAFLRRVRGAVLSFRVGLRKPEAAIFRTALRRAGIRPDEALLIDDMPENVSGARRIGMRALRYDGAGKLELNLRRLGLIGRRRQSRAKSFRCRGVKSTGRKMEFSRPRSCR